MRRNLVFIFIVLFALQASSAAEVAAWRNRFHGQTYAVGVNPHNPNSVYAQGTDGRLFASYNRGVSWNPLGTPGLTLIRQIIVHPADTATILCVAFAGGIRKSTDYGVTWRTVLADFGIDGESIALDPKRPDTLYAGDYGDGKIYRSSDRGDHWTLQGTVGSELCGLTVRPDSSHILLAGTGGGRISRSTDEGVSWVLVKPPGSLEIPKIVVNPRAPKIAYGTGYAGADTATGIWKTVDGGLHWDLTPMKASLWALDIDPLHPDTVWTGTFSVIPAEFFRSRDGGTTWDTVSTGLPYDANAWNLKIHPLNPSIIWLAAASTDIQARGLYRWITSRTSVEGTVIDALSGDTLRAGMVTLLETGESVDLARTEGRFSFSYFEGDSSLQPTLRVEAFPYRIANVSVDFIPDSQRVITIPLQRLGVISVSGTIRDSISLHPLHARVRVTAHTLIGEVSYTDSTDAAGGFVFDSLFASEPGIVDYETLNVEPELPHPSIRFPLPPIGDPGIMIPVLVDTADVLVVQATESDDYSRIYLDALDSLGVQYALWDQFTHGQAPFLRTREFRTGTVIYYTGRVDHPAGQSELDSLEQAHAAGANIFITGQNFVEENDSSSFVNSVIGVTHEGNLNPFAPVTGTPGDLLDGVTLSTLGGTGVNNQNSRDILHINSQSTRPVCAYGPAGAAGVAGVRIPGENGTGRVTLLGFGFESIANGAQRRDVMNRVLRYCASGIVTGVDGVTGVFPLEFTLGQNYPNPFNPSTNIGFTIADFGRVRIAVYDLLGREVAVLVNEHKAPGTYSIRFDASGLSSGVYLYRLTRGRFVQTRKMVVIK